MLICLVVKLNFMNAKELKDKTIEELKKILAENRENLFKLKQERFNRKLKKVSEMKRVRHLIARILTIIQEKELAGEISKEK